MKTQTVMLVACNWGGGAGNINAVGMVSLGQRESENLTIELIWPRQVTGEVMYEVPKPWVIVLSKEIDMAEIDERLPDLLLLAIQHQRKHIGTREVQMQN